MNTFSALKLHLRQAFNHLVFMAIMVLALLAHAAEARSSKFVGEQYIPLICKDAQYIVRLQVEADDVAEMIRSTDRSADEAPVGYVKYMLTGFRMQNYKGSLKLRRFQFYSRWEPYEELHGEARPLIRPGDYIVFLAEYQKPDKTTAYHMVQQPGYLRYSKALEDKLSRNRACHDPKPRHRRHPSRR